VLNDQNRGEFTPEEHIGHITKDFSSLIAPILILCEIACYPAFECHLQYSDTNHSRAGYDVDIIIRSIENPVSNLDIFRQLEELHLSPTWV
jgi:hypothetical protein